MIERFQQIMEDCGHRMPVRCGPLTPSALEGPPGPRFFEACTARARRQRGARCVRHEYEYCDVCVIRSDDNMVDDMFQVSQRLTSDLTTTPQ